MNRQQQESILGIGLHQELTETEVLLLEALSYGHPMDLIVAQGLGGRYFSSWTLYQYRSSICSKLDVEFGKGSRKFIWLTGRYYDRIRKLADAAKEESDG